jgi:hypothetical protein
MRMPDRIPRYAAGAFLAIFALTCPGNAVSQELDGLKLEYHAAGWTQFGKIEHSFTGADNSNDYNKNWMQSAGSKLDVGAQVDSNWSAALSLGVVQVHLARGAIGQAPHWFPFWVGFNAEASVTYSHPVFRDGKFQLTLGSFPYNYNPDVKNLGLYLLNGYVYPGIIESGSGSVFGGLARYRQGEFTNDLILKSEDAKPVYDLSLADIASYQVFAGFTLGAGINFYRLISQKSRLTSPGVDCGGVGGHGECFIRDTVKADTGVVRDAAGNPVVSKITGSLAGTKVMGRFRLDPKALTGWKGTLGENDLVLYGEAAVLGLKNYKFIYDDIMKRIPVMVGFNFPAFSLLDFLSLEVEYYPTRNSSDNSGAAWGGSWVALQNDPDLSHYAKRDDWKWSVNAAKTIFGHVQASALFANDHLRPGGSHDIPWIGKEALRTPSDWYWSCKVAYFF